MDESDEQLPPLETADAEIRELLGLFDVPAFARRGQDLEFTIGRIHARCRREREAMLQMVRLRLRQWAAVVTGPEADSGIFAESTQPLWQLVMAEPPLWAAASAPLRRQRAVARDLVASLNRFNRRWERFLAELDLSFVNRMIEQYNHYYLLEKECCLGSARLAARMYEPRSPLHSSDLLKQYPLLPVPGLAG